MRRSYFNDQPPTISRNASIISFGLILLLIVALWVIGCSDERTKPTEPPHPSYNESIPLMNRVTAAGQDISASFTLRDTVTDGRLYIYGFIKPDDQLNEFLQLDNEIDSVNQLNEVLNGRIINSGLDVNKLAGDLETIRAEIARLEAIAPRTQEQQDSLDNFRTLNDSLSIRKEMLGVQRETDRVQRAFNNLDINGRLSYQDIHDIALDNRFKVSVSLDNGRVYYPNTVFINNTVQLDTSFFQLDEEFFDPSDGSLIDTALLSADDLDSVVYRLNAALFDSLATVLDSLRNRLDVSLRNTLTTIRTEYDTLKVRNLGDSLMVWGQGFYLTPVDTTGWRGMRMSLDITEFWVADAGWDIGDDPYLPVSKPQRGDPLPEPYPVREWLTQLTPNQNHTIHIRFAAPGTTAEITANLYVVYKTAE